MDGDKCLCILTGISLLLSSPVQPGHLANDVALNKPAVQSLTFSSQGDAGRAVDGDRNSCASTPVQTNPWWRVDLSGVHNINAVLITNRDKLMHRIVGTEIWLSTSLNGNERHGFKCAVITTPIEQTHAFYCRLVEARYITLFLPGQGKVLSVCEVEVYKVFELPFSNVALRGDATQSSTFSLSSASKAIDARRNSHFTMGSCSHTLTQSHPWWRVDLRSTRRIFLVKITNRGDCCSDRLNGAEILVGNDENHSTRCATVPYIRAGQTESFYCEDGSIEGRFVTVTIPGEGKTLTLCEVEVYAVRGEVTPHASLALGSFSSFQSSAGAHDSSRAIDGCANTDPQSGCCSQTLRLFRPWWKLDMNTEFIVNLVRIIFPRSFSREYVLIMYVGNTGTNADKRCAQFRKSSQSDVIVCNHLRGRYIFIEIRRLASLSLCEVEVYGSTVPPPAKPPPPTTPPPLPSIPPPPTAVVPLDGRNATVVGLRLCWADALFYCRDHYQDLLSVHSQQEQSAVEQLMSHSPFPITGHVWLGLRRYLMGDRWFWMSGEPMDFSRWTQNLAPHRTSNPCGGMARDKRSQWGDQPCQQLSHFICQSGEGGGEEQVYFYSTYYTAG